MTFSIHKMSLKKINNYLSNLPFTVDPIPEKILACDERELESLSDEHLLALIQFSNAIEPLKVLQIRYFNKRYGFLKVALPTFESFHFDGATVNLAMFVALSSAIRNYGWSAKFSTYFLTIFKNEIIHKSKAVDSAMQMSSISLDFSEDQEERTLMEEIPSESEASPESRARFNMMMDDLKHLPKTYDRMSGKVAVLLYNGYAASEIADVLHITESRTRRIINGLRHFISEKYGYESSKKRK